MSETTQNFYMEYKPTRLERFWRWAGFRSHVGAFEEETTAWAGWMRTETTMHLSLADRLRLLISGRLALSHSIDMDTPSPSKTFTRFDWRIRAPGEKRP